jgi:hypothetical protein
MIINQIQLKPISSKRKPHLFLAKYTATYRGSLPSPRFACSNPAGEKSLIFQHDMLGTHKVGQKNLEKTVKRR